MCALCAYAGSKKHGWEKAIRNERNFSTSYKGGLTQAATL